MAAAQSSDCQLSNAIQNLHPELREKIYKDYIAIKLRQRAALGWDKVHQHFSKLPFCHNKQRVVRMIMCLEHNNCRVDGCCFSCFQQECYFHKLTPPPIEEICEKMYVNDPSINCKTFFCYENRDWHDKYYNFIKKYEAEYKRPFL